jgi:hypothetical protein
VAEASAFDLQTLTRKSHTAAGGAAPAARGVDDSTHQISKGEKPPQEKAADKS